MNIYNNVPNQRYACDFLIMDENNFSHFGEGKSNEDYYAYGKQILAAAAGVVTTVVDGVPENIPGQMNPFDASGNSVVIKVADGEYITYTHLKTYSIKVKPGDG